MTEKYRAAVVTVSDGVTHGTREDLSGDLAEAVLDGAGFKVAERRVVPDERDQIEKCLSELADAGADGTGISLVITTGGTGFGPRDVTPEATKAILDREAPGLVELMLRAGLAHTANAALSRAAAGSRGLTLIINTPGSPKGVRESLNAVLPVVPHALDLLSGETGEHSTGHGDSPEPLAPAGVAAPTSGTVTVTAVKVLKGSPPCAIGSKMVIGPGGPLEGTLGCAEFDSAAISDAFAVLSDGRPQTSIYHHDLGDIEVFLEPNPAPARLLVFGATPVALELLGIARRLGYETVLVESRTERITPQLRLKAGSVLASLEGQELTDETDAVHTDHDAPGLAETIAALLKGPTRFIGIMGSRRHVAPHREALAAMGFSDEDIARVHSPVGLNIGSKSPAEIALSIVAGLIAAREGRDGEWMDTGA